MWGRLFLTACALFLAAPPAEAGTVQIFGSGVLDVAQGQYAVGDPFSFSVTLTDEGAGYNSAFSYFNGVGSFDFTIRGDSYSEPEYLYRAYYDGATSMYSLESTASSFLRGGFDVYLGRTDPQDLSFPLAEELNGRSATFNYLIAGLASSGSGAFVMQAVPETGAWLTMIVGVGAAGAFARRRRQRRIAISNRIHSAP